MNPNPKNPSVRRIDRDEVMRLLEDLDASVVARRLGCSTRQVQRIRYEETGVKRHVARPFTEEEDKFTLALLEDRTGYWEASRTTGRDVKTLMRRFPGYSLTRAESIERANMGRLATELSYELTTV